VTAAAAHQDPHLVLWLGDLVDRGRQADAWRDEFQLPARRLVTRVPSLAVPGNHDEQAPLLRHWFSPPGGGRHWQQRCGDLQLIGLDGADDWQPGGSAWRWLDAACASAAEAPYLIVCTHYPAWTSTGHGRLAADGQPAEPAVRAARAWIMPLLQHHRVTCVLSGHAHAYERSQPPDEPLQIGCGGAGGYLYHGVAKLNPHSRCFAARHHYLLLSLGQDLSITATALDGEVIEQLHLGRRPIMRQDGR
jgi:3',5'-cyclic AMP phosphodiesterase CpdA